MPNIKSAKKRAEQSEKRRMINYARKSDVKTAVKKVLDAVAAKDVEQAKDLLKTVQAKLARAAGKSVLHRKTASRKMSRLAKKVSELERPKA